MRRRCAPYLLDALAQLPLSQHAAQPFLGALERHGLRVNAHQRAPSCAAEGLGEDGSVVAIPDGRVDDSVARPEQRGPVALRKVGVRVQQRGRRHHWMAVKLALGWRLGCEQRARQPSGTDGHHQPPRANASGSCAE